MDTQRTDLHSMHRLLHCHQWSDVGEWVRAVGSLAELTDAEIEQVAMPIRDHGPTEEPR